DPVEDRSSSASDQKYRGNLHFVGNIRRVIVSGNTWRTTTGTSVRCIGVYGISRANPAGSDPDVQEATVDGHPTYPSDITIRDNTFDGFAGATPNATVFIHYAGTGSY